jgi:hypothetical protein
VPDTAVSIGKYVFDTGGTTATNPPTYDRPSTVIFQGGRVNILDNWSFPFNIQPPSLFYSDASPLKLVYSYVYPSGGAGTYKQVAGRTVVDTSWYKFSEETR